MSAALDGLRVVDFTRILAGPLSTMMLADLGAEVIKIERPDVGDDTRAWGPPFDATGTATYFQAVNRNKTGRALDLTTAAGLAEVRTLISGAGVVVENFRPGVMDRLGLGYADLSRDRADLVYCSISAFGDGAGATMPGYDLIVQAVGGLMSITGSADGGPQKVGVALVDVIAGLNACIGILAAVRHAERTGTGQHVRIDLLSSLLTGLVNQSSAYTAAGVVGRRLGNAHPSIAPYETLPTADGEIAVAVGNDRQFGDLCAALGLDELPSDDRFATNAARVTHRADLRAALCRRLASASTAGVLAALTAAGVPAGPVNDIAGAFALAETLGLDPVVTIGTPDGHAVRLPRNPIRMSHTPPTYRTAPPTLP